MPNDLLSIFEVAERLKLHVKTVRSYVREGRLKATRIGKQYRIARVDLEALTGHPLPPTRRQLAKRSRYVQATSVIEINAISREAADRVMASVNDVLARQRGDGETVRVEKMYDEELARMKVIVDGGLSASAELFQLIKALAA